MAARQTISVYDRRAGEYAERFANDGQSPRLETCIDAMPKGGQVLDRLLGAAGFAVFGKEFGEDRGLAGRLDPWITLHATAL